jgi:hypothetical protein
MTEPDTPVDLDQVVGLRGGGGAGGDAELEHGSPEQVGVTYRVRRRHEKQALRVRREDLDPSAVALLDPAGQRRLASDGIAAGPRGGVPAPGELEQSEGIAASLGDDPVSHGLVHRTQRRRPDEFCGVLLGQPAQT